MLYQGVSGISRWSERSNARADPAAPAAGRPWSGRTPAPRRRRCRAPASPPAGSSRSPDTPGSASRSECRSRCGWTCGNRGSNRARIRSAVRSNTVAHAVNGPPSAFTASRHDPPSGATSRRRSAGVSDSHDRRTPLIRPPRASGSRHLQRLTPPSRRPPGRSVGDGCAVELQVAPPMRQDDLNILKGSRPSRSMPRPTRNFAVTRQNLDRPSWHRHRALLSPRRLAPRVAWSSIECFPPATYDRSDRSRRKQSVPHCPSWSSGYRNRRS